MTDYQIFKACFPELIIDETNFSRLACGGDVHIFREDGGFASVRNDHIELLCVAPVYQGRGVGTKLLKQCEEHICTQHDTVHLSGNMLPGIAEGSEEFFRRNGYDIGGLFNEMSLELADLTVPQYDSPEGAKFCFYDGDITAMRSAVAEVDDEWVQYFDEDGLFFVCMMNGEIASFCIVGEDECCLLSDGKRIGSVGCVGTVPKFRRNGIGLHMVALASEHLKSIGCDRVFIHYTHLDKWYGKLGAETFLRFLTAEKAV